VVTDERGAGHRGRDRSGRHGDAVDRVLFAIGSACFLVGPLPGFVELVGSEVDAAVFFVGSIFFTSAALLQMLHSGGGLDRWSCVVQFAGTLFFNVSTFHALQTR
jgi:hypothetical protein